MRWAGHVAGKGDRRGAYKVMVARPEVNRPPGRPRFRQQDTIETHPQEVGQGGVDWIDLAQDRDRWRALVNEVMNLPWNQELLGMWLKIGRDSN
jgi:hypothetical protein